MLSYNLLWLNRLRTFVYSRSKCIVKQRLWFHHNHDIFRMNKMWSSKKDSSFDKINTFYTAKHGLRNNTSHFFHPKPVIFNLKERKSYWEQNIIFLQPRVKCKFTHRNPIVKQLFTEERAIMYLKVFGARVKYFTFDTWLLYARQLIALLLDAPQRSLPLPIELDLFIISLLVYNLKMVMPHSATMEVSNCDSIYRLGNENCSCRKNLVCISRVKRLSRFR